MFLSIFVHCTYHSLSEGSKSLDSSIRFSIKGDDNPSLERDSSYVMEGAVCGLCSRRSAAYIAANSSFIKPPSSIINNSLAFVQKLRAGDNGFDKRGYLVPARRQLRPHRLKQRLIRKHQRTAERVDKRLFAQAVQKILLATGANITLQAVESGALTPARERRLDIHRTPGEVFGSPLAYRTVAFKRQAEGIETSMAGGACGVLPVFGQHIAYRQIRLRFVARQFRDYGRRRRNHLAQHAACDPISTLHRTGP